MPKCPKCGKDVGYLDYVAKEFWSAKFIVDEDGFYEYDEWDYEDTDEVIGWRCPKCFAILFRDEADAIAFLWNGKRCPYKHENDVCDIDGEKCNREQYPKCRNRERIV